MWCIRGSMTMCHINLLVTLFTLQELSLLSDHYEQYYRYLLQTTVRWQSTINNWRYISAISHRTEISTAATETTDLTSHQCHITLYWNQYSCNWNNRPDFTSVPCHTVLKLVQLQLKQQTWLHISAMSHCTEISTAPTETTDLTSHQCHVTLYWSQYTQQQKQHFILCTQAQQLLCFVFI